MALMDNNIEKLKAIVDKEKAAKEKHDAVYSPDYKDTQTYNIFQCLICDFIGRFNIVKSAAVCPACNSFMTTWDADKKDFKVNATYIPFKDLEGQL